MKTAGKVSRPSSASPRSVNNSTNPNPGSGKDPRISVKTMHGGKFTRNPKF